MDAQGRFWGCLRGLRKTAEGLLWSGGGVCAVVRAAAAKSGTGSGKKWPKIQFAKIDKFAKF